MRRTRLEAIYDNELDQMIIIFYDINGEISGLNYHYGDNLDMTYINGPDEILTNIYRNIMQDDDLITVSKAIKKALEIKHMTIDWGN